MTCKHALDANFRHRRHSLTPPSAHPHDVGQELEWRAIRSLLATALRRPMLRPVTAPEPKAAGIAGEAHRSRTSPTASAPSSASRTGAADGAHDALRVRDAILRRSIADGAHVTASDRGRLGVGLVGLGIISRAHLAGYARAASARASSPSAIRTPTAQPRSPVSSAPAPIRASATCSRIPDVAAVDLTLPHHVHYEATAAALAAGRHVLVEKPFARGRQSSAEPSSL